MILAAAARNYIGTPYKSASWDSNGLDCVGLVLRCLDDLDCLPQPIRRRVERPYSAQAVNSEMLVYLKRYCDVVATPETGDLLLYKLKHLANPTHLAIYAGNNQMIHASNQAGRVVITGLPTPEEQTRLIILRIKYGNIGR